LIGKVSANSKVLFFFERMKCGGSGVVKKEKKAPEEEKEINGI
jgi:hypothetical protein